MSARRKGASSRPPNAQTCPWLMFSHGKSHHIQTFYSITDNRILKRMLPHLSGSIIRANYDGWAVITSENPEDGDSLSCFLLHLTTMEKILLPDLEDIEYNECFLSSSPLKPNCVVAFISTIWDDNDNNGKNRSRIKFWRTNQENWVEVIIEGWLSNLITCDGIFYGIKSPWYVMVDIHDNDVRVVNQIETPDTRVKGSKWNTRFLIESCGDVFLVWEPMFGVRGRKRMLQVYKLMQDEKIAKMNWIKISDIGDHVFFRHVRFNSFSCSAPQACLKGNSIYFSGSRRDKHVYRYSLSENRYYRTLPCPDVAHDIRQICWLMIDQRVGLEL